jgi:LuxR family maltose regulon positive regulatory protein
MFTPLLTTKYRLPPAAKDWVQRARLLARLDELLLPGKRLRLVSALAGSGKTTLVRSWAEQNQSPGSLSRTSPFRVAWLSLDEEDNDPATFMAYVIAALKTACPEIDLGPISEFKPDTPYAPPPMRFMLGNVVNQLAGLSGQIIMVFDDYHTISATAIHEAITFLLDHLPDCARLVIITRAESLLPISRLRARGQLVEIREADLRFTVTESAAWLNETMGLNLNPAENQLLVERTEVR